MYYIMFSENSCWEAVCKQYSLRSKENTLSYCDIYDGMVYKQLFNSGFLSNCHNISLIVNIDGVPVFRSSSYSFWPIWIVVNELPYRMRYLIDLPKISHNSISYVHFYIKVCKRKSNNSRIVVW